MPQCTCSADEDDMFDLRHHGALYPKIHEAGAEASGSLPPF